MAAFFSDVLDKFLSPGFLKMVQKKYHYDEMQMPEFMETAEEMFPFMCDEAFWERNTEYIGDKHKKDIPDTIYESVVMSLGKSVDDLQESYIDKGFLSKSYMVLALSSEILMQGYNAYNCFVMEGTEWHVARYHFLGSEDDYPLELLPHILNGFTGKVTCNSAFVMQPKNSVVFISELTQDESIHCKGVCSICSNLRCTNNHSIDIEK